MNKQVESGRGKDSEDGCCRRLPKCLRKLRKKMKRPGAYPQDSFVEKLLALAREWDKVGEESNSSVPITVETRLADLCEKDIAMVTSLLTVLVEPFSLPIKDEMIQWGWKHPGAIKSMKVGDLVLWVQLSKSRAERPQSLLEKALHLMVVDNPRVLLDARGKPRHLSDDLLLSEFCDSRNAGDMVIYLQRMEHRFKIAFSNQAAAWLCSESATVGTLRHELDRLQNYNRYHKLLAERPKKSSDDGAVAAA